MNNDILTERLNEAIDAIITHRDPPLSAREPEIASLLAIAAELRNLPRADFKAQLKTDLERRVAMKRAAVKPMREGFHTITPYLRVPAAVELIDFVKSAFGAQELMRTTGPAGGIHAEVAIGDSIVMIGGGDASHGAPMPTALHLYVPDADAVYDRAIQAGAASTHPPIDQPYGDREAGVKDLSGNYWYIATHKATGLAPEGLRTVTPYLHPRGAEQMIDFLKSALGAEEQFRHQSPDGVIHHATLKIGDSVVEMGEAHGPWQPMPTMFYLYVDDVDGWYRHALANGGASISEPKDQPFGDRLAGVRDPFDNEWFLATAMKESM
jgi:PhnB protein